MKGFRAFLLQGNLIELATAFVIGTAFAAVIKALVDDVVNPVIAIPGGKPNFDSFHATANGSVILYGTFITALISFVLIGAALYVFIVLPYTRYRERRAGPPPRVPAPNASARFRWERAAARTAPRRSPRRALLDVRPDTRRPLHRADAGRPVRHRQAAPGRLRRRAGLRV